MVLVTVSFLCGKMYILSNCHNMQYASLSIKSKYNRGWSKSSDDLTPTDRILTITFVWCVKVIWYSRLQIGSSADGIRFYFPFTCKLFIHFSTCIICWTNAPGVWRPSETHWRNDKIRSSHLHIPNGYSLLLLTAVKLQPFWHLSDSRHMESSPPLTKQDRSPVISWWLSKCMYFLSEDKMKNSLGKLGRHWMSTGISTVCLFKLIKEILAFTHT